MRISDWSSDVCSSDLIVAAAGAPVAFRGAQRDQRETGPVPPDDLLEVGGGRAADAGLAQPIPLNRGATNRFTAAHPAFRQCDKPRHFRRGEVCRPTYKLDSPRIKTPCRLDLGYEKRDDILTRESGGAWVRERERPYG